MNPATNGGSMSQNDDVYRVRIEAAENGGCSVVVTKAHPYYVNVRIFDTVDECRAWAASHVAWLRSSELIDSYEL